MPAPPPYPPSSRIRKSSYCSEPIHQTGRPDPASPVRQEGGAEGGKVGGEEARGGKKQRKEGAGAQGGGGGGDKVQRKEAQGQWQGGAKTPRSRLASMRA